MKKTEQLKIMVTARMKKTFAAYCEQHKLNASAVIRAHISKLLNLKES